MSAIKLDDRYVGKDITAYAHSLSTKAELALQSLREKTCQGAEFTGWLDGPRLSGITSLAEIKAWQKNLAIHYDCVVVCGIGGSFAGTKAVNQALNHSFADFLPDKGKKPIYYAGHNLSEVYHIELLDLLEHKKPLVVVISKSGTTTEPGIAFRILRNFLETKFNREASERIIAVTDQNKGALRNLATKKSYKTFVVPDDVGGRFSVLTNVGLVPLTLAGYDTDSLLAGAGSMYKEILENSNNSLHPCLRLACLREAAWQKNWKVDALAYCEPKLAGFVEWWKQLYGESEGKNEKGLFPASLAYSTDLHSLGQYMQDGYPSILETFLFVEEPISRSLSQVERRLRVPRVDSSDDQLDYLEERFLEEINHGAADAALLAHQGKGVPCIKLSIPRLDAFYMGQMFAFFMTSCAVSALLLGVNPFDQPGVETYKRNLFALMGKPGFENLLKT